MGVVGLVIHELRLQGLKIIVLSGLTREKSGSRSGGSRDEVKLDVCRKSD